MGAWESDPQCGATPAKRRYSLRKDTLQGSDHASSDLKHQLSSLGQALQVRPFTYPKTSTLSQATNILNDSSGIHTCRDISVSALWGHYCTPRAQMGTAANAEERHISITTTQDGIHLKISLASSATPNSLPPTSSIMRRTARSLGSCLSSPPELVPLRRRRGLTGGSGVGSDASRARSRLSVTLLSGAFSATTCIMLHGGVQKYAGTGDTYIREHDGLVTSE